MSLIIVRQVNRGDAKRAPTYRVRCPRCGEHYVTTGYPREIRARRACHDCTSTRPIDIAGERVSLSEWARRTEIARGTLWHRIHVLGWTPERAITTPLRGAT